jgi:hypothetical protein
MDYSLYFQNLWDMIISYSHPIQIISYFAIVGTFIGSIVTFSKTFKQNKKTEQIKVVIEIKKHLSESENALDNAFDQMKYGTDNNPFKQTNETNSTSLYGYDNNTKLDNTKFLEPFSLTHFNNWEWFALLVNTKFISEDALLDFFKGK